MPKWLAFPSLESQLVASRTGVFEAIVDLDPLVSLASTPASRCSTTFDWSGANSPLLEWPPSMVVGAWSEVMWKLTSSGTRDQR